MDITLRQEASGDYEQSESVTREAFWNQYAPGCMEHYLLHIMRTCPAFIPELDIVALSQNMVVGHAICLRAVIHADSGREHSVLTLGPLSVLPAYQHRGIGGRMIAELKDRAKTLGFPAILLCGDPDYYKRQGFLPAEVFGIRTADNLYLTALQACELSEHALRGAEGRYCEDAVYAVDPSAALAFDRHFPPKTPLNGTPSQKRFQTLAAMYREADTNQLLAILPQAGGSGENHIDPLLERICIQGTCGPSNHIALRINKIGGWKRIGLIGDGRIRLRIIEHREGIARLLYESCGSFHGLPAAIGHVDHEEMNVLAQFLIGRVKFRHLALAGTAPTSPEIQHNRLAHII